MKSLSQKNKLYKKHLRSRSNDKLNTYKTCKNKLTRLLRIAKKQHYEALLVKNKSAIKATWKILNFSINRKKCKPLNISLIQEHGVTITDSEEIANRFC